MLKINKRKITYGQAKRGGILLKILISLVILFISTQLYVLTSVGTQGERVSELRRKQADIKIENEIIRANILELQSNKRILTTAIKRLRMKPTKIRVINAELREISALDNE